MAFGSLLALLDDIATVLDDVAVLMKVTTTRTAGVLGDDLALNGQQVSGVRAERELPVVWAVTKGSVVNKAILVPAALAISAFAPWAVTPLLMLGGTFLCFEGFEKIVHLLAGRGEEGANHAALTQALADPQADFLTVENDKVRGAIRTDFILSAEIIVIALGTVSAAPFGTRVAVLVSIAALMTVGVYGLVASIVKLDDVGLWLAKKEGAVRSLGKAILLAAPWLMKTLSAAGMAAMFLVGGGILSHGIPPLYHWVEETANGLHGVGGALLPFAADVVVGIVVGGVVLAGVTLAARLLPRPR